MTQPSQDWVDGFLVVGNHPALDLLNTNLWVNDQRQELLTDPSALARWLHVAGLAGTPEIERRLKDWSETPEAKTFLRQLLRFREELREAVLRLENGKQPTSTFLADLNARLFAHPVRKAVIPIEGKVQSTQTVGLSVSDTFWAALLSETADLLASTERNRIRQCETCMVHFFDTSKKNARRWCSMRLCGNRVKVAAYQDRQRRAEKNV
jgi:predicted RNA-binding Zn ribbon-like protein